MSFEKESIKPDNTELKEDFLEVDQKIPGQNYVCLSFVSPEKVLKKKELYFMKKFLHYLMTDKERSVSDIRERMLNHSLDISYENVDEMYNDWKYQKSELLEAEFFELNEFQTSMRGIKIRGTYDSYKEASVRAQLLRKRDPSFDVFVGQVGYWLPFDPSSENVQNQEYQENQLNELVKKYKENLTSKDDMYEQIKNEKIEKARKEVELKKAAFKEQQKADGELKEDSENVTEILEQEHEKNIEKLREIVDESDKLYYDNLKKNSVEEGEGEREVNNKNVEEEIDIESQTKPENHFVSSSMEKLESDDPWIQRKKNESSK
jgi:hypothetical protein